jgi:hypothetical protein
LTVAKHDNSYHKKHLGGIMKFILSAVTAASFLVAAPALVQAAPIKSLQLSKVLLDTETITATGKIKGGTLCVFPSDLKLDKVKKTEEYERYDVIFSEKVKGRGYKVVTTSQDLFASQDAEKAADYLIGATLRPETINVCSSVNGYKGEMTVQVEWQIYDRIGQKVVEVVKLTGKGTQLKFAQNGYTEMWNNAFGNSLLALMESGTLKKYTGEPDAAVAAATMATEAKAAADAAMAAAAEAAKKKNRR